MAGIPFSLRIDPRLKAALDREAEREKRSTGYILQRAAEEYLERRQAFDDMVDRLEAEADKGAFVSGEAVDAWVESWDTVEELPVPGVDVRLKKSPA